jgi:cell division protein ZapA (FtsZ GTPase activity inhibitor)
MLKSKATLEEVINGKVYTAVCDNDSPLDHLRQFANNILKYCDSIEEQVKAAQAKMADESAKAEEAVQVVEPVVID